MSLGYNENMVPLEIADTMSSMQKGNRYSVISNSRIGFGRSAFASYF
jgi:hypothetical protein